MGHRLTVHEIFHVVRSDLTGWSVPAARGAVVEAAGAAVDLILPSTCAGCGRAGRRWCVTCEADLLAQVHERPRHAEPQPAPPGLPPVVAAGVYAGALRTALVQVKDGGRVDLRRELAPLLAAALSRLPQPIGVVVVPIPSAPRAVRRRGEASVTLLARAAVRIGPTIPVLPVLRLTRAVADQAGLGRLARAANLAGAYAVRPGAAAHLAGRPVLLVDDVLTTGATLSEAAAAVRVARGRVLGAAVVASTRLGRGRG